ncbi:HNH endonuclease signature motif containing protein [Enterococcus sp. LJL120]
MAPDIEKQLNSYDVFLLDLTRYMNQVNAQIKDFKYIDLKTSSKLKKTEINAIKSNYKLMSIKPPKDITIKKFKKDLLTYTLPDKKKFPEFSKLSCRTNGIWLEIITFIFKCDLLDFSIFFSENEYKNILNTNKNITHNYFNKISSHINNGHSVNILRNFFDYLYDYTIDSSVFLDTYKPCINKTTLRREIAEEQKFCPCCMLYETSTGNSQIDHYIPRNLTPFFSIYSKNLIISCPECNSKLVKGDTFLSPILHPNIDNIKDNIKYCLNDSSNIEIYPIQNKDKTVNFCTQFMLEDRINGIEPFSGKKKKCIDDELEIFKKIYLEHKTTFEKDFDIIYDYYTENNSKEKDFFYKIITDIASTLTDKNSVFYQTITLT